jgi:hypothetical protein
LKNYLLFGTFIFLSICVRSQSLLPAEKIAIQMDSIIKADGIKMVSIYFHKNYNDNILEQIAESSQEFKFIGQFLVLSMSENYPKYYNLNKLLHFTVLKKQQKLQLYFEVY